MLNNEDGVPHFAYYIKGIETSFVWRLDSPVVQICPGGYGEPPVGSIIIEPEVREMEVGAAFQRVKSYCDNYASEVTLSRGQQSV